jgi:hypothetical protein
VFLQLDRTFHEKVLHLSPGTASKTARAIEEGEKMRALISYLRTLFRGAEESTDPDAIGILADYMDRAKDVALDRAGVQYNVDRLLN